MFLTIEEDCNNSSFTKKEEKKTMICYVFIENTKDFLTENNDF